MSASDFKPVLFHGDALAVMADLAREGTKFDAIITDPPYGILTGINIESWQKKDGETKVDWDVALPPAEIFSLAAQLLRHQAPLILFACPPYTYDLGAGKKPHTLHRAHRYVWQKTRSGHCLGAATAPISVVEDVLVWRFVDPEWTWDYQRAHPLRAYFRALKKWMGKTTGAINRELGHQRAQHAFDVDGIQFSVCTVETYAELIRHYRIDRAPIYKHWPEICEANDAFWSEFYRERGGKRAAVFNLPPGEKSKPNLLTAFQCKKNDRRLHPTQKPVALMVDLVQTYTMPGACVLDFTMGSGTTGVACKITGRHFTGIEKDAGYYSVARKRLREPVARSMLPE